MLQLVLLLLAWITLLLYDHQATSEVSVEFVAGTTAHFLVPAKALFLDSMSMSVRVVCLSWGACLLACLFVLFLGII